MPEYRNPFQEILSGVPAPLTYDDVAEWWDNSEWSMSTYPPSSWFAYAEQEGLDLEDLQNDADNHESGVAELHANLETCPDCGNGHDRRPCIESAAICGCCTAIEEAGA